MANEYRIRNHPLEEVGDYTMTLYIDMLCTVASYENSNPDAAYKLIANIMLSAGMKHPISEHIKNAMQLTPERFSEFVTECRNNELQYIFLIDSLLIICSNGQPCKKQIEFIAGIAVAFSIKFSCFKYLSEITANIIKQDSTFFSLSSNTGNTDSFNDDTELKAKYSAMCYVKQFSEGILINSPNTSEKIYYLSTFTQKSKWWGYSSYWNQDKIVIENIDISYKDYYGNGVYGDEEKMIVVEGASELILRKCNVTYIEPELKEGPSKIHILKLENCILDFDLAPRLHYSSCICADKIYVSHCTFKNYISNSSSFIYRFGKIFHEGKRNCVLNIANCTFENSDLNRFPSYAKIKNTKFIHCKGINDERIKRVIEQAKQNGCQFIDCK